MWLKSVKSFLDGVEIERIRLACLQVLGSNVQVSISEVSCPEPGCPPIKTVIIVFRQDAPTGSITIHKSAREVKLSDIRAAMVADQDTKKPAFIRPEQRREAG